MVSTPFLDHAKPPVYFLLSHRRNTKRNKPFSKHSFKKKKLVRNCI